MDTSAESSAKHRLIYVITEDWSFVTHFLPVARAARDAGFEVVVVTNLQNHRHTIEAENLRVVQLAADRRSLSPLAVLRVALRLRKVILAEQPNVVHAIALKSIVLIGIATLLGKRFPLLGSFTGLGYLWSGDLWAKRAARVIIRLITSWLALKDRAFFSFENKDDCSEFPLIRNSIVIGGWGIDIDGPAPSRAEAVNTVRIAYLGRMLRAKGIADTVEAVRLARAQGSKVELELWGKPDPGNFTTYTVDELKEFSAVEGVKWMGEAPNIATVWDRADIAILLSEREGMPRALIEAAAFGLPMIATDVAGCRSIVRDGIDGILVPCKNPARAAQAIIRLAHDVGLRNEMSRMARAGFEQRFSTAIIVPKVLNLYLKLYRSGDSNLTLAGESTENQCND